MKNPTNRNSIYHSAQINLEKRFGRGGSIVGAYTWSKLISDTDTITGWLEPGGGYGGVQDNYNIRAERSLALYDTPHRAVIGYVVDLPFGKGQPIGNNVSGVLDRIVSGWGVIGNTTFQSGNPLPISVAVNTANALNSGQRPNRTGVSASMDGSAQSRLNQWFNTATYSLPAPFTFGNASRTMPDFRSHGIADYSFTIFKSRHPIPDRDLQSVQPCAVRVSWNCSWQSAVRHCQRPVQRTEADTVCATFVVLDASDFPACSLRRDGRHRNAGCNSNFQPYGPGDYFAFSNRTLYSVSSFCALSFGQAFYGSMVGSVNDARRSAVRQANVTLANLGTAERRISATDAVKVSPTKGKNIR